jgi:plastocyanin
MSRRPAGAREGRAPRVNNRKAATVRRGQMVRMRSGSLPPKRYMALAAVLGLMAAVLPAVAASETAPSVTAHNQPGAYGEPGSHSWTPSTVTIGAGGSVKFINPYTETYHGLKFTSGPSGAKPACTGIPKEATEPVGALHWEGECTFSTPGTYLFVCTVHPEMTGSVTVNQSGTTTVTTTPPTTTTTTTTPSPAPSSESPLVGNVSQALRIAKSQRGGAVRGSVAISKAGAGGRLEVDLLAANALLAASRHHAPARVGRLVRSPLPSGKVSFTVVLSKRAREALKRHHELSLTVKVKLEFPKSKPVNATRTVIEHS